MSEMTQPIGSVCVEIVPGGANNNNPELRLTLMSLQNNALAAQSWTFLEHHLWIGNSIRDIPRDSYTGVMDTTMFMSSWSNYTHGSHQWQTQIPLDCQQKQEHTFRIVISSVATFSTSLFPLSNSTRTTTLVEKHACFALEYDGQAGGSWYGWMEITVDCQCAIDAEHDEDSYGDKEKAIHADPGDFYPYGTDCQDPELFRLLESPEWGLHCWDILDTALQSPINRLCVDITSQDMHETELTFTFTPFDYMELTQTSLWAGIHPGDTIHSVPRRPEDSRYLHFEAFDHFFANPNGLPNNVAFVLHLPTNLCSSDTGQTMSPNGVMSIPVVAQAFAKTTSPDDITIQNDIGNILGGYAYEYRYINDNVEFGWVELDLQCGCSKSQGDKALSRNGTLVAHEETFRHAPTPPSPPSIKTCRTAFAYASPIGATIGSAQPLEDFGYNLWGYTNGPFAASNSYIVLDLVATIDGSSEDEQGEGPQVVGTVKLFFDGEDAVVTFALDGTFSLQNTFLYVGEDALPVYNHNVGKSENRSEVRGFDFPYHHGWDSFVDAPYADSYTVEGFDYSDTLYVMALAKDCTEDEDDDEDKGTTSFANAADTAQACLRSESSCYNLTSHDDADAHVGQVCFSLDKTQEYLNVRYSVEDGWTLSEAQVWVGPTLQSMPMHRDKSPNLRDFENQRLWYKQSRTWSTLVPLLREERCGESQLGDFELVVVAHALVGLPCGPDEKCGSSPIILGSEQNVYADETLLQKKDKWFYYIDMRVDCNCDQEQATDTDSPTMTPSEVPGEMPSNSSVIPIVPPSEVATTPSQAPTKLIDIENTCIYAEDGSGEYCLSLYAPHAWETDAGSVCLAMVDGQLVVIYDVVSSWSLTEVNVWVGPDLFDLPIDANEPDTKNFPFRRSWSEGTGHYTEVIPTSNMTQDLCQRAGAYNLYIVAHGLVAEPAVSPTPEEPFVPYSEEDAFAKAYQFEDMPSSYYVLASVICDCAAFNNNVGENRRSLRELKAPTVTRPPVPIKAHSGPSAPGYVNSPSRSPAMTMETESSAASEPQDPLPTSSTNGALLQEDTLPLTQLVLPSSVIASKAAVSPVLSPSCHDAWAVDESLRTVCFPRVDRNYTYGWSNGPLPLESGIIILDLYLATGDCSRLGTSVGTVWVSWEKEFDEVIIDFKIDNEDYYMDQTHVYMGDDPLYRDNDDSMLPVMDPVEFPLQHRNLSASLEDTHTVKVASNDRTSSPQLPLSETLRFLSAHATVCTAINTDVSGSKLAQRVVQTTTLQNSHNS
jgi:hypothetical protein